MAGLSKLKRWMNTPCNFASQSPIHHFLDYLTFGILPEHLLGDLSPLEIMDSQFNMQPVGSGPYSFDHFLVENDQIIGVVIRLHLKIIMPILHLSSSS